MVILIFDICISRGDGASPGKHFPSVTIKQQCVAANRKRVEECHPTTSNREGDEQGGGDGHQAFILPWGWCCENFNPFSTVYPSNRVVNLAHFRCETTAVSKASLAQLLSVYPESVQPESHQPLARRGVTRAQGFVSQSPSK